MVRGELGVLQYCDSSPPREQRMLMLLLLCFFVQLVRAGREAAEPKEPGVVVVVFTD